MLKVSRLERTMAKVEWSSRDFRCPGHNTGSCDAELKIKVWDGCVPAYVECRYEHHWLLHLKSGIPYRTLARQRWPNAVSFQYDGRYAVVIKCPSFSGKELTGIAFFTDATKADAFRRGKCEFGACFDNIHVHDEWEIVDLEA